MREKAVAILSQDVYQGFWADVGGRVSGKKYALEVSRETLRGWMTAAGLWHPKRKRVQKVHTWRARRSRFGELVQVGYQRARLAGR
jgi:hypothetical protein